MGFDARRRVIEELSGGAGLNSVPASIDPVAKWRPASPNHSGVIEVTVAVSPRMKLLIVAVRRALLILYDALGEYAGLEARRAV